jgi:subtilisin family serine protease
LAWARPGFRDAAEVTVMVADTGVDAGHPALDSVISRYDNPLSGIEDDADRVGHGTHVAGIISAVAGPDGIRGVCAARIAAVKVLPTRSDSWDEVAYLRGLASSLDVPGVRVLNLSLGSPHRNRAEAEIIAELIAANIVVVAAMGNEYRKGNATSYPAAHPGVIAVGASDELDQRASFSNTGGHIALAAPGVNILSTLPRAPSQMGGVSGYGTASGTSMATPYVSAAAALLLEKEPGLTPAQVRERLCETCDRVGSPGGRDEQLGWGRLNLFRALA